MHDPQHVSNYRLLRCEPIDDARGTVVLEGRDAEALSSGSAKKEACRVAAAELRIFGPALAGDPRPRRKGPGDGGSPELPFLCEYPIRGTF